MFLFLTSSFFIYFFLYYVFFLVNWLTRQLFNFFQKPLYLRYVRKEITN